ncbi:hypothetical protein BHE74_00019371 [Ensete ventricosum]|nr:hypothetical protein GW17_00041519 [Ensete ventricosum]RWW72801.1 hypothetical protein BHE74_00019371 [Ensete ventricosum]
MIYWQWVVRGAVDVDIGANPSAEGGDEEGVDDTAVKVVDIVDTFVGESMHDDGSMVFAYYKDGAVDPTFIYFAYGLKEVKC